MATFFALQPCHGGVHTGASLADNLCSDRISPTVLSVALHVPGLDDGHGLQLADGRLYAGLALAGEGFAGLVSGEE